MRKSPREKTWWESIFPKLVAAFMIIIVPIIAAGVWLNMESEKIVRDQAFSLTWEQMEGNLDKFDSQVNTILNLQRYFCNNNSDMRTLANLPEAFSIVERAKAIQRINEQFTQIKLVSSFVADVRVHLRQIEKTISSYNINGSMDYEEYNYILGHPESMDKVNIYDDKLIMVSTSVDNLNYARVEQDASFFLVAELSQSEIMDYMTQGDYLENSSTILLNDDLSYYNFRGEDEALALRIARIVLEQEAFGQQILKLDGVDYLVLHQVSPTTGLSLIKFLSFEDNFPVFSMFKNWVIVFIILVIIVIVLFSINIYNMVQKPVNILVEALRSVEKSDFSVHLSYDKKDEFQYLYHRFNRMVVKTKDLIEQVYEQEILTQRAELKQLQSQINPHFLYNSLFIISVMARQGDMDFVESFAQQLGQYFQFIVKNNKDMLTLQEEMAYAGLYADIQQTRFSNRLQVDIEETPSDFKDKMVPKLIIQPLIENAIAYGLEKRRQGGILKIRYEIRAEDALDIIVEDNGENITDAVVGALRERLTQRTEDITMSGIFNIHRRLKIFFGEDSGLRFEKRPEGGLKVTVAINFGGKHV